MKSFFTLSFVPTSQDVALLFWRIAFGGLLFAQHGWGKIMNASGMMKSFPDPLGMGHGLSFGFAAGAEALGALCLVVGLCTRWAALGVAFTMAVAFLAVHDGDLKQGEMAVLYFAGVFPLLLAGGGRLSFDAKLGSGGGGGGKEKPAGKSAR